MNIRKLNIAGLVIAAVLSVQAGHIGIDWTGSAGFYFNADPFAGILGGGTGNSTIAQLIYSPDANVDAAVIGGGLSGDDQLWQQITLTEGDNTSEWADFSASYYNATFTSGYVYARIFQDSSIEANDWYYFTAMISVADLASEDDNQILQMNTDLANGNAIDSGLTVAQVVPEPATALLLGIGGGIAWLIRLKQRLG